MKFLVYICLWAAFGCAAVAVRAESTGVGAPAMKGFVKIRQNVELYTEYVAAQPGRQTVVLLNGLTYSTTQWNRYAESLIRLGFGVVRYDMQGMGRTLLRYAPALKVIPFTEQAKDLKLLLTSLRLSGPYNLVGLSYGGGIAIAFADAFPGDVKNLILMAPYTEALAQQDQWIKSQIWVTRQTVPWNTATDDQLYDFFLRQIIYTTYPSTEPIVLENPYKLEGIFRLVQGIRKFRAVTVGNDMPVGTVHLIIAGKDQYIPRQVLLDFWKKVSPVAKRSVSVVVGSEHKIPEDVPKFSAALTAEIVSGNKAFFDGRAITADPASGLVKYSGGQFHLPKEY